MQKDTLVAFGNAEYVAHFGGLATLNVAQRDHRALPGRQVLDRALDCLDRFAPEQLLLRPRRRRRRPMPRPVGMIGRPEPGGIDGGLAVVFRAQRRERDRAGLPDAAGPRAIGKDAEDPSAKERPSNCARPLRTPSHASCTTSSATARLGTNARATCSIDGWSRWTRTRKACSSPTRSAASTRSSSEIVRARAVCSTMEPPGRAH